MPGGLVARWAESAEWVGRKARIVRDFPFCADGFVHLPGSFRATVEAGQ